MFTMVYSIVLIMYAGYFITKFTEFYGHVCVDMYIAALNSSGQYKQFLASLDADGSGAVSHHEIKSALEKGNLRVKIDEIMAIVDKNDDGKVLVSEVKESVKRLHQFWESRKIAAYKVRIATAGSIVYLLMMWVLIMFLQRDRSDWNLLNSSYWVVITFTTIGLGDYTPDTSIFVKYHLLIFLGLGLIANLITSAAELVQTTAAKAAHSKLVGRTLQKASTTIAKGYGSAIPPTTDPVAQQTDLGVVVCKVDKL